MPNGADMLDDMKFDNLVKEWTPAEQFLARQVRDIKKVCEQRLSCSPQLQLSRKQIVTGLGGTGAIIATLIADIISRLT